MQDISHVTTKGVSTHRLRTAALEDEEARIGVLSRTPEKEHNPGDIFILARRNPFGISELQN